MNNVNIATLIWVVVLCSLVLGGAIGFIARGSRHLRLWSAAMLTHGVAYLLLALRGSIPDVISIVVANTALITSYMLIVLAIARFKRLTVPGWVLWSPVVAVALVFVLYIDNQQVRSVSISFILFAQQLPIIYLLLRNREGGGPGQWLLIVALVAMASIYLSRVLVFLFGAAPAPGLTSQGLVQSITYLSGITALLLVSIGFIFMVKERAEQALSASEQHFRAFFERSMVGMATQSVDMAWIEINPALCTMLGYTRDELRRIGWAALIHPDDRPLSQAYLDRVAAGEIDEYELDKRLLRKDGAVVHAHVAKRCVRRSDGSVDYLAALIEDITERKLRELEQAEHLKQLEELNRRLEHLGMQLLQVKTMASIGQLAAGVAHEINNPVSFVSSNLNTLSHYLQNLFDLLAVYEAALAEVDFLPAQARARAAKDALDLDYLKRDAVALLQESRDGLERVRKIVLDLKDYSHAGTGEWQWTDLHQCLEATLNVVASELNPKCNVSKDYGEIPLVLCLPSQLNQVFMNLLLNAVQAIETRGDITITTRRHGAESVQIRISDTGKGIPAGMLGRVFEPFFTTKPVGQGTGLGLSLAWSIVQRHQGKIGVTSVEGQGTTFTVTLPVEPDVGAADGV